MGIEVEKVQQKYITLLFIGIEAKFDFFYLYCKSIVLQYHHEAYYHQIRTHIAHGKDLKTELLCQMTRSKCINVILDAP